MDSSSAGPWRFTPEVVEERERDLALKVAAGFRTPDRAELQAELFAALVELKRRSPVGGARDWKAYLAKALLNRASYLAKKWRKAAAREAEMQEELLRRELQTVDPPSGGKSYNDNIRAGLPPLLRELFDALLETEGDQGLAAKRLGIHRNTVVKRLRQLRRSLALA